MQQLWRAALLCSRALCSRQRSLPAVQIKGVGTGPAKAAHPGPNVLTVLTSLVAAAQSQNTYCQPACMVRHDWGSSSWSPADGSAALAMKVEMFGKNTAPRERKAGWSFLSNT